MRIVVAHTSPDLDAIASVWLIKKFLPGWQDAVVKFVPAGERLGKIKPEEAAEKLKDNPIEQVGQMEVIQVDTGFGPLDHHATNDQNVCAASLTLDFIKKTLAKDSQHIEVEKLEALERIVKLITDDDHFREVFYPNPAADHYEFSLGSILDGIKLEKQNQDNFYVDFISECFNALLHQFENRVWAEKEIKEKAVVFDTRFGKGFGIATVNDTVIKLGQKMGYVVVLRKDPRKNYVRIKVSPKEFKLKDGVRQIDLTLTYEKLKKIDPSATWFLHVSKRMLLNGTTKNPKMKPSKLALNDIIEVLKGI